MHDVPESQLNALVEYGPQEQSTCKNRSMRMVCADIEMAFVLRPGTTFLEPMGLFYFIESSLKMLFDCVYE